MKKKIKEMNSYYQELYSDEKIFRQIWQGKVGLDYLVPKEVNYVLNELKNANLENVKILELGAGDGLSTVRMINNLQPKKYVATERSSAGVDKLKNKGIDAQVMDATDIKFDDNSFDIVCCFNVMHHVDDPEKMAQEMIRVSKKYVYLCESNGLSILRKILEFTPANRKANENSYLPSTYKRFFKSDLISEIGVHPFMFIYTGIPEFLYKPCVWFSELMERLPFLRWQCAGLFISMEKK
jgi:ubiquinone/menaquinone biosynthesis C-methylase UbiE